MKLHEYQSKELLSKYGVPVPGGEVTSDPEEARKIASGLGKVVVKAQVLMGGRGKAGGVKLFDNADDAAAFTKELIGKRLVSIQNPEGMVVEKVLVAAQVDIAEEYYVSVLLDRAEQKNLVMISAKGGMDIEEVAENEPEAIVRLLIDPAWGLDDFQVNKAVREAKIPKAAQRGVAKLIKQLAKAYVETDAELIEINPVALTPDGKVIAADAKVAIDDNALFRHPSYDATKDEAADDPVEAEAARLGIAYVKLGGDIGIMGNGAGLVMCSLDEVNSAGGKPANFLDVGGGAKAERVKTCVSLILKDPNVKGLLINIFGGITRCDEVARGVLQAIEELDVKIPVVARIEGTAAAEGRAILEGSKVVPAESMQEAAQKIVSLAYGA
jgi:succinyl-CoA synthetase beta subunit